MFNKIITKRNIILLIISVVIGTGIFSSRTLFNVSPCAEIAGCDISEGRVGNLTTTKWGYPASYRETSRFTVNEDGNYMESNIDTKSLDPLLVLANSFFWFTLLSLIVKTIPALATQNKQKKV